MSIKKQTVNLKKQQKQPVIPKPPEINLPGMRGTLPFNVGITGQNDLGKQIPKAIIEESEKILKEQDKELAQISSKKIDIPKPVDIDSLPEEKRNELLNVLKEAGSKFTSDHTKTKKEPTVPFIPAGPGVMEAKQHAKKAASYSTESFKETITTESTKSEAGAGLGETSVLCTHCGWPVGISDLTNPTYTDKQIFIAAFLGQKRFIKEFNLFNGQFKIIFRGLTTEETDLIVTQLVYDWNSNKFSGPAHAANEASKYQLVLALESIETENGPIKLPTLEEYDYEQPKEGTILPEIVKYVYSLALPTESHKRIVTKAYQHFIDTQSKLEAMAEKPDFWMTTED